MILPPQSPRRIHLVGACGTGMAALAGLLRQAGLVVTGSDAATYQMRGDEHWFGVSYYHSDTGSEQDPWEVRVQSFGLTIDWENETAINHDGWRLVSLRLPALYPSGYYTPSYRDWRCQGGKGKGRSPAFPIRLTRLYVVMRSKLVYVTDMVPAKSLSIEVSDLCVGAAPVRDPREIRE